MKQIRAKDRRGPRCTFIDLDTELRSVEILLIGCRRLPEESRH